MKIKESAWHLRYVRWTKGQEKREWDWRDQVYKEPYTPRDLCSYFWGGCLYALIATLAAIGAITFLTIFLVVLLYQIGKLVYYYPLPILLFLIAAGITVGVIYGIRKWRQYQHSLPPQPPKEPNIVVQGFKAVKHKYCPLIEIVKDET